MKKINKHLVVLVLIGLVSIGCVFASKNTVNIQFFPAAYQQVRFENDKKTFDATGFGAKVGYRYNLTDNSSTGISVSVDEFKFSEDKYFVYSLMAEVGTSLKFLDTFSLNFDLGLGADYRVFRGCEHFYPAGSLYFGLGITASESLDFTIGSEFRICDQYSDVLDYCSTDINWFYSMGLRVNL